MKQLNKKIISGLLSLSILMSLSIPVFAYNSTGSSAEDLTMGSDEVQDAATEYHDPISSGVSSAQTDVYSTRSSTFTVLVPKTIILSGSDGTGSYIVGARGDVLTEDAVTIEPTSYELTLHKKGDEAQTVQANIEQPESQIGGYYIEQANNAWVVLDGSITSDLKAGSWKGSIVFNIGLQEQYISYEDFVITPENRYKIGFTNETTDLEIPTIFYDEEDDVLYKVVAIGQQAFDGSADTGSANSLTSVVIPNSVTRIEDSAFKGSTSLTSINIPDSVTYLGSGVFQDCSSLVSVTIPNGITSIGFATFSGCNSLEFVDIPDSVASIDDWAFYNCEKLTSIHIPNIVTRIGNQAFKGCTGLTSIEIPESVTVIGDSAFFSCTSLTDVVIPDSVTYLGMESFYACTNLKSIIIGNSVTSIGNQTFMYCYGLASVTIGDSVTSIGSNAFAFCSSLSELRVPASVTTISSGAFQNVPKIVYNGSATGSPWGAKAIAAA